MTLMTFIIRIGSHYKNIIISGCTQQICWTRKIEIANTFLMSAVEGINNGGKCCQSAHSYSAYSDPILDQRLGMS